MQDLSFEKGPNNCAGAGLLTLALPNDQYRPSLGLERTLDPPITLAVAIQLCFPEL